MSYVNAPIHDMLIRIKNAYMARRQTIDGVIVSTFKQNILELLKKHNFIKDFSVYTTDDDKSFFKISLLPVEKQADIPVITFFSKPSRRWFVWYKDIKKVAGWRWIWIISTSKWVMDTYSAWKWKIWWELIAEIY